MAQDEDYTFWLKVLATLDEARARWYVAQKALELGRGGILRMHELTGMSRPTILKGIRELKESKGLPTSDQIRQPGGGRKPLTASDPSLLRDLERILEENTAGDPMSLLRWSSKSTTQIAQELSRRGHSVSADTIGRLLKEMDYSLQANFRTKEVKHHPDRDRQFRYLNDQVKAFLGREEPVISVDTKKKERVGEFKNPGKTWRKRGHPQKVLTYDFPSLGQGMAVLYGTYDVWYNQGLVNIGTSHDTAEFAVESIRRWWAHFGQPHYPRAQGLLICADGGGSNGSRNRGWKYWLQQLADELRLTLTVCHYPPGTSKWNKIEHRMFSFISIHWKGEPLVSYETIVNLISSTRTSTGLKIKALLDSKPYQMGVTISDAEMERLKIQRHELHPKWNYTIAPRQVADNQTSAEK